MDSLNFSKSRTEREDRYRQGNLDSSGTPMGTAVGNLDFSKSREDRAAAYTKEQQPISGNAPKTAAPTVSPFIGMRYKNGEPDWFSLETPKALGKGAVHGTIELGSTVGTIGKYLATRTGNFVPFKDLPPQAQMEVAGKAGQYKQQGMSDARAFGRALFEVNAEYIKATKGLSEFLLNQGNLIENYWGSKAKSWEEPSLAGKSIWDNPELLKSPVWWAYNVGDMLPGVAASMVGGFGGARMGQVVGRLAMLKPAQVARLARLGGAVFGGAVGGSLEGAATFEAVLAETGDPQQAANAGELMALFSGMLNAISVDTFMRTTGDTFMKRVRNRGLSGIVESLTEGAEEPAEVTARLMSKYLNGEEIPEDVWDLYVQSFKDAIEVMPLSFVMGYGMHRQAGETIFNEQAAEQQLYEERENYRKFRHEKLGSAGYTMPGTLAPLVPQTERAAGEAAAAAETAAPAGEWEPTPPPFQYPEAPVEGAAVPPEQETPETIAAPTGPTTPAAPVAPAITPEQTKSMIEDLVQDKKFNPAELAELSPEDIKTLWDNREKQTIAEEVAPSETPKTKEDIKDTLYEQYKAIMKESSTKKLEITPAMKNTRFTDYMIPAMWLMDGKNTIATADAPLSKPFSAGNVATMKKEMPAKLEEVKQKAMKIPGHDISEGVYGFWVPGKNVFVPMKIVQEKLLEAKAKKEVKDKGGGLKPGEIDEATKKQQAAEAAKKKKEQAELKEENLGTLAGLVTGKPKIKDRLEKAQATAGVAPQAPAETPWGAEGTSEGKNFLLGKASKEGPETASEILKMGGSDKVDWQLDYSKKGKNPIWRALRTMAQPGMAKNVKDDLYSAGNEAVWRYLRKSENPAGEKFSTLRNVALTAMSTELASKRGAGVASADVVKKGFTPQMVDTQTEEDLERLAHKEATRVEGTSQKGVLTEHMPVSAPTESKLDRKLGELHQKAINALRNVKRGRMSKEDAAKALADVQEGLKILGVSGNIPTSAERRAETLKEEEAAKERTSERLAKQAKKMKEAGAFQPVQMPMLEDYSAEFKATGRVVFDSPGSERAYKKAVAARKRFIRTLDALKAEVGAEKVTKQPPKTRETIIASLGMFGRRSSAEIALRDIKALLYPGGRKPKDRHVRILNRGNKYEVVETADIPQGELGEIDYVFPATTGTKLVRQTVRGPEGKKVSGYVAKKATELGSQGKIVKDKTHPARQALAEMREAERGRVGLGKHPSLPEEAPPTMGGGTQAAEAAVRERPSRNLGFTKAEAAAREHSEAERKSWETVHPVKALYRRVPARGPEGNPLFDENGKMLMQQQRTPGILYEGYPIHLYNQIPAAKIAINKGQLSSEKPVLSRSIDKTIAEVQKGMLESETASPSAKKELARIRAQQTQARRLKKAKKKLAKGQELREGSPLQRAYQTWLGKASDEDLAAERVRQTQYEIAQSLRKGIILAEDLRKRIESWSEGGAAFRDVLGANEANGPGIMIRVHHSQTDIIVHGDPEGITKKEVKARIDEHMAKVQKGLDIHNLKESKADRIRAELAKENIDTTEMTDEQVLAVMKQRLEKGIGAEQEVFVEKYWDKGTGKVEYNARRAGLIGVQKLVDYINTTAADKTHPFNEIFRVFLNAPRAEAKIIENADDLFYLPAHSSAQKASFDALADALMDPRCGSACATTYDLTNQHWMTTLAISANNIMTFNELGDAELVVDHEFMHGAMYIMLRGLNEQQLYRFYRDVRDVVISIPKRVWDDHFNKLQQAGVDDQSLAAFSIAINQCTRYSDQRVGLELIAHAYSNPYVAHFLMGLKLDGAPGFNLKPESNIFGRLVKYLADAFKVVFGDLKGTAYEALYGHFENWMNISAQNLGTDLATIDKVQIDKIEMPDIFKPKDQPAETKEKLTDWRDMIGMQYQPDQKVAEVAEDRQVQDLAMSQTPKDERSLWKWFREGLGAKWHSLVNWLDVEAPWKRMGAETTGHAFKNFYSAKEYYERQGIKDATDYMRYVRGLFGKNISNQTWRDILFAAEDENYLYELDEKGKAKFTADQRKLLQAAADLLILHFEDKKHSLHARGINVDFKARMLHDIDTKLQTVAPGTEEAQVLIEARELFENYNFVHIPIQMLFKKSVQELINTKVPLKKKRVALGAMKSWVGKTREQKTLRGVWNQAEKRKMTHLLDGKFNPITVIINYSAQYAHDMALSNIRSAMEADGLARKVFHYGFDKKLRPVIIDGKAQKKLKGSSVIGPKNKRHTALIGYSIDRRALDALEKVLAVGEPRTRWEITYGFIKMAAFYNPIFLPAYDVLQWGMTWELPKQAVLHPIKFGKILSRAMTAVRTQNEDYKQAILGGAYSKPFDLPRATLEEHVQRVLRGTKEGAVATSIGHTLQAGLQHLTVIKPDSDLAGKISDQERAVLNKLLSPVGLAKAAYRTSWASAWAMDEFIRTVSFLQFRDMKGIRPVQAAQLAARFHGDYASVPAATRKKLNKIFFTPTFKIAMAKLYGSMIKGTYDVALGKAGKSDSNEFAARMSLAKGLIGIAAVNFAFDTLMRSLGYEPDDEDNWAIFNIGRRYTKTVDTEYGPKEYVFTWSHPGNIPQRYLQRIVSAVKNEGGLGEGFLNLIKWDLHPAIQTAYGLATNMTPTGDNIISMNDSRPKKWTKRLAYAMKHMLKVMEVPISKIQSDWIQPSVPSVNSYLAKKYRDENIEGILRLTTMEAFGIMSGYMRDIKDARLKRQIQYERARLRTEEKKLHMTGKPINQEWIDNFVKRMEEIAEERRQKK